MRNLERRVAAIEEVMPPDQSGMIDLNALSIEELERLETIVIARDAGTVIEDMPDADLRFIASIGLMSEAA